MTSLTHAPLLADLEEVDELAQSFTSPRADLNPSFDGVIASTKTDPEPMSTAAGAEARLDAPLNKANAMYRSVEMGEEVDETAPLPMTLVGTFSCHGMDNNVGKINQDCACVVYPCQKDERTALFIVLDGHGALLKPFTPPEAMVIASNASASQRKRSSLPHRIARMRCSLAATEAVLRLFL